MSRMVPKKVRRDQSWLPSRWEQTIHISPQYHLIVTEGSMRFCGLIWSMPFDMPND